MRITPEDLHDACEIGHEQAMEKERLTELQAFRDAVLEAYMNCRTSSGFMDEVAKLLRGKSER